MKGILAGSLGVALGLLASTGRAADDIIWRATRENTPRPVPAAPAPAPTAIATTPTPTTSIYYTAANVARIVGQPERPAAFGGTANPLFLPVAATESGPWGRARAQSPDDIPRLPSPTPARSAVSSPLDGSIYGAPGGPSYQTPMLNGAAFAQGSAADYAHMPSDGPLAEQYAGTGRAPRIEVTAEYLAWWVRGANGPPLVTTSPPGMDGFLPGAAVLLSVSDLDHQYRSGARFGLTYWCDDCASYGFDARYFFTGPRTGSFIATSDQYPNLFRPFVAANDALGNFSEQVTGAGSTVGSIQADLRSNFWGAEANYRDNLFCWCGCSSGFRIDLLAGFRYLNLDESLQIVENYTRLTDFQVFDRALGTVVTEPAGTQVSIRDHFGTDNDFYGGQIGTVMQYQRNRWTFDMRTTVALGTTHQRLSIDGSQVRTLPGQPPLFFQGGLLALDSNIGKFSRDEFSVVPEVGLNIGYQMNEHWRVFAGYNFLYWSNVIRPGDQIDTMIDVNRVPRFAPPGIPDATTTHPAVMFNNTDFWAQGINLGLEYRW